MKYIQSIIEKAYRRILTQWYFKHYNHGDDIPFGDDVAYTFTYLHIKYLAAQSVLPKAIGN